MAIRHVSFARHRHHCPVWCIIQADRRLHAQTSLPVPGLALAVALFLIGTPYSAPKTRVKPLSPFGAIMPSYR